MHNRLKDLRAERGWNQTELAERLEVSRQSVNAIETGRYDPSLPLAFRIADLFDQRIEDIFVTVPVMAGIGSQGVPLPLETGHV